MNRKHPPGRSVRRSLRSRLLPLLLASVLPVAARSEIDFSTLAISEIPVASIEAITGSTGDTSAIDGVTFGPSRDIYLLHRDDAGEETIVRFDPEAGSGSVVTTNAAIASGLGPGHGPALIFEGGFDTTLNRRFLYFMDSGHASVELALGRVALHSPGAPSSLIFRSPLLDDASDFAVLPDGSLVVVRGAEGVGIVDPGAPSWNLRVSMADLQAALGTSDDAPPESVCVHPITGDVFVFCHDVLEVVRIRNLAGTPQLQRLAPPNWPGVVDLHDLSVDEAGNLYGFDEGAESLVVFDGEDSFELPLDDLAFALRGGAAPPLAGTLWRGLAARKINACQSEVFLASSTGDYGVIRVLFGVPPSIDYDHMQVTRIKPSLLEALVGAPASTAAVDGVALGPGDDVFLLHRNASAVETVLRIDSRTMSGSVVSTSASMIAGLGTGYGPDLIFEGGFATTRDSRRLYFADSGHSSLLLSLGFVQPTAPGAPTGLLLRSSDLDDMSDFAVLPGGEIVGVRGDAGLGVVNPSLPTWVPKVSMADVQAILGTSDDAPPEAVAVHPLTGDVIFFAHDVLELFRATDVVGAPSVTQVSPPGWGGAVDLHDLAVDENGTIYGFDEAAEAIVISGPNGNFTVALADIAAWLGPSEPPLEVSLWRGMAARAVGCDSAWLYLASATPDHGVVIVKFGGEASNGVLEWQDYD